MKFLSPAKINLHLRVLGKRPDGYHEIETLMQRIDLCDEVEMEPGGEGISLTGEGEETPPGEKNLTFQAARIFFQETGIREKVRIRLRKRIPVAAGLGGGSSNAATVLMGLDELFHTGTEANRMMAWGARIGADVPFFIFQKPAWARGKGEKLQEGAIPGPLHLLLLVPPFRISTAWAYEAYDRLGVDKGRPALVQDSYPDLAALLPILQNDLERASIGRFPQIGKMKQELLNRGARGALMSGSGPVVFGLFADLEEVGRAGRDLALPPEWKAVPAQGI